MLFQVDGEWVTPAGWHPEEEEAVEDVVTEGDVPFTGRPMG